MNTFESLDQFNTYKVSANDDNTSYTFGLNSDIYDGAPDILWKDICL